MALALATGCGGGGRADDPPSRDVPAGVALAKTYSFAGRSRTVRARIAARHYTAPLRDDFFDLPRGRRPYRVAVVVADATRDRFPFDWARFTLVGRRGATVTDYQFTPLRSLEAVRRVGGSRMTIITFGVPPGFGARELRLRSTVRLWPFRARWSLGGS